MPSRARVSRMESGTAPLLGVEAARAGTEHGNRRARLFSTDYVTPIRLGMVANYGRGNVISADRTPEISPCSKSSYFQMQPESWLSHSPPGITYGSPPVLNRLSADRGPRLALRIFVNLRQTFEEGSCFRLQSEKAQAPEDSRESADDCDCRAKARQSPWL